MEVCMCGVSNEGAVLLLIIYWGWVYFVQGFFLTPPSFMAASKSAFLLLDKSFIIDMRCFCGVFVLAMKDKLWISTHHCMLSACSLIQHVVVKAWAFLCVMLLHFYKGFKWLWFKPWAATAVVDVKCFVWMFWGFANSRCVVSCQLWVCFFYTSTSVFHKLGYFHWLHIKLGIIELKMFHYLEW